MLNLIHQYTKLLQKAEQTTNRKEAIKLIRESTRIRELMLAKAENTNSYSTTVR